MKKLILALLLLTSPAWAVSNTGTTATLSAVGALSDCAVGTSGGANTKAATLFVPVNAGAVGVDVSGAFVATLTWAGSVDGLTYFAVNAFQSVSGVVTTATTVALRAVIPATGLRYVCVFVSAFTSGAPVATMEPIGGAVTILNLGTDGAKLVPLAFGSLTNQSSANISNQSILVTSGADIAVTSQPAVSTTASASVANAAGVKHIATSCSVSISTVAAQPDIIVNLRDGATGAGTIIWTCRLNCAISAACSCTSPPLNILGTTNTAMTCETAAAPATNNFATASLTYHNAG